MKGAAFVSVLAGVILLWPQQRLPELTVAARPSRREVRRVGVNLGLWTSWGAEQLSANVLKNPGFEGVVDGAIVVVRSSSGDRFTDDTSWLARPMGFWDGGSYSIRTGALAGQEGIILRSAVQDGFAEFRVAESTEGLQPGDVVAVRATHAGERPTQWWYSPGTGTIAAEPGQRPAGDGRTTLRLTSAGGVTAVFSYLDAIGARAGKLLPINGNWSLSVWVKADRPDTPVQASFQRQGSPAFLAATAFAGLEWRQLRWDFAGRDDGPPGVLELRIATTAAEASLWLDDASLRAEPAGVTAFRDEVISALAALRPGYLRDWQGQLGDTFQNRLAPESARAPSRYRPGAAASADYGYSLPEFLELCAAVGASPWVVLPPVMSDEEWSNAGAYLSSAATKWGFSEIVVEFGNENWNPLFRPAGIPNPTAAQAAASRGFRFLRSGAHDDPRLVALLGGDYYDVRQLRAIADPGRLTGVAPYWAFDPQPGSGPGQLFSDAGDLDEAVAAAANPAIYEMNASSLGGSDALERVNELVTSRAAGGAMAWHALRAMNAGVTKQCVYSLAGFDAFGDGRRLVRLFGIMRDLASGSAQRPTAMALALLNRAIQGEAYAVNTPSADYQAMAFRSGGRWSAAICSRSAHTEKVRIRFPAGEPFAGKAVVLDSPQVLSNNENETQVYERETPLWRTGGCVEFEIPAYGFAVLSPAGGEK